MITDTVDNKDSGGDHATLNDCDNDDNLRFLTSLVMSAATHSTGLAEAIPLNASLNVTSCKAYLRQKILQKIFT